MKRLLLLVLLLFSLLASCAHAGTDAPAPRKKELPDEGVGAGSLPEKMPEDFALLYEEWVVAGQENVLDTFEGKLQKDLVEDGTAEVSFTPSRELLEKLYRLVRETGLTSLTRTALTSDTLAAGDERIAIEPLTSLRVTFRADGKTYSFTGDATAACYRDDEPDAARFTAFCESARDILTSLPEFRAMPDARGYYE